MTTQIHRNPREAGNKRKKVEVIKYRQVKYFIFRPNLLKNHNVVKNYVTEQLFLSPGSETNILCKTSTTASHMQRAMLGY